MVGVCAPRRFGHRFRYATADFNTELIFVIEALPFNLICQWKDKDLSHFS